MGSKRIGLARVEALLENLKRELNLGSSSVIAEGFNQTQNLVSIATSGGIDLTDTKSSRRVFIDDTLASTIKLPQATAANAGMMIEIYFAHDVATNGSCVIAVANTGSTVFVGNVSLQSTGAKMDVISISSTTGSTKAIHFDADAPDHAGGKEGTMARFYYVGANAIYAEVRGITSAATPALDANAVSATGF